MRLAPWLLFLFALGVRAVSWPHVFTGGRVVFFGNDAYYHMRRIRYALHNFPDTLDFDPYVNFPVGAKTIWPPFLDSAIAFLLRPFYEPGNERSIEILAAWIPPVLGAGTVVVLYFLARHYFGSRVAVVAGLILSVLHGHFLYSQIGFVDHHVAVSFGSTLLLFAAMGLLLHAPEQPGRTRFLFASSGSTGILCAGLLMVWPGSILYVAIVEVGFLVYLLTRPTSEEAAAFARLLAFLNIVAFLLIAPFSAGNTWPQWSEYSSVVLSRFQPWFFGALSIFSILCERRLRRTKPETSLRARQGQCIAIGCSVLGASFVLLPELRLSLFDAWEWFGRDDRFQASILESMPLFALKGAFTVRIAEERLSRFVYLFPLALAALAYQTRKRPDAPACLLLIGWSAALAIATLMQQRFSNTFSVALALSIGWGLLSADDWISRSHATSKAHRVTARFLLTVATLFALAPSLQAYLPPLRSQWQAMKGNAVTHPAVTRHHLALFEVGEWLREHSPPTRGLFDSSEVPEYGLLSIGNRGHVLKYVAQRPTVLGPFGNDVGKENYALGNAFFRVRRPELAFEILERLRARYVIIDRHFIKAALSNRLYRGNGSGLERLRLVFLSPPVAAFKVFEFVEGAQLRGRSLPEASVRARLHYTTPLGTEGQFAIETQADADGNYALRVPYSTRDYPGVLRLDEAYVVVSAGMAERVSITERQVQTGEVVEGPDFSAWSLR